MKNIIIGALVVFTIMGRSQAAELVHQFQSPAFSGIGWSSHVLTIEQMEAARTQKNKDEQKAQQDKADRDARNTNLAKFLVNVESRIYAQLSKQLADAMFAEGGGDSGAMDFQGTKINWIKSATDVTLTITEALGGTTQITVPIASFAF
jgi:opacity protein-like surface antigen